MGGIHGIAARFRRRYQQLRLPRTQDAYEIRVELAATKAVGTGDDRMVFQPAAIVEDSVADLFFDSDGDDLTYTITAVDPDLDTVADDAEGAGYDAMTAAGMQVYSSYTTVTDTGTDTETSRDPPADLCDRRRRRSYLFHRQIGRPRWRHRWRW